MQGIVRGVGDLLFGFRSWGRHGSVMSRALIPATIVAALVLAGFIALAWNLPGISDTITPFADGWAPGWAIALRIGVSIAILAAAIGLVSVSFTAVTLTVGEPFYDRVWRAIEAQDGEAVPEWSGGFARALGDGASLLARGLLIAAFTLVIGFLPGIGGFIAPVVGAMMNGRLLADELTSRALDARGYDRASRRALRRTQPGRVLGFGVAAHLCFLVPLGAIVAMPSAVAGSTRLAQDLVAGRRSHLD